MIEESIRQAVADALRVELPRVLAELRAAATPAADERMSVAEHAERWHFHPKAAQRKVRQAIVSGAIHPPQLGRALRLTADEFRAALEKTSERTPAQLADEITAARARRQGAK